MTQASARGYATDPTPAHASRAPAAGATHRGSEAVVPGSAAARAPRARLRARWFIGFGVTLLAVYVGWGAFACANQQRMIFPGVDLPRQATPGPTDPAVQQVWLTSPDGVRVEGWYQPGRGRTAAAPGPALMFFHGNYDLVDRVWSGQRGYPDLGISVLVMEYRGYGRVKGAPSQEAIVADALMFRDWLAGRPEVDGRRIIYQGLSLGGGVAAALAERQPPAALILECTFTSMEAMAARYLLPGFLVEHPFRTEQVLARLDVPVLIFHGRHDAVIPVSHGRRLHAAAPRSRYVELNCGHHNYCNDWGAIVAFLRDNGLTDR